MLVPYFAWPVRWSVEGYFYLDSTRGTKDVDTLVGSQLGRAGEGRGSLPKIQDAGGEPVGFELWIIFHDARYALWFGAEDKTRQRHVITADVEHSAASRSGNIADVARVIVKVGKERLDGAQGADFALAHHLPRQLPLRMEAIHERLHDLQVGILFSRDQQLLRFGDGGSDGLFT